MRDALKYCRQIQRMSCKCPVDVMRLSCGINSEFDAVTFIVVVSNDAFVSILCHSFWCSDAVDVIMLLLMKLKS